ncbi:hemoglobin/transferrin/lactoferrin receptor protein [Ectothiorhodosinus mongolicus]|uniref:Hemoglobin/transferrin/lactoferrin receptor protein n=1 Tax=Ectothiorhodosinus mongolicus TaxID=233100 RepID=A0A1R3VM47_9GAMM|nr:TonB-dependent receptor [Ectothiorhodosinus mongolicus]ULX57797.1 TonB-dependent receptor [Ectothiorhodosinus mongolicus]SIT65661.1 hemoglobin/transferrin/lactoferrin receptor protein [Ectothiorhodosinus mongolicus]
MQFKKALLALAVSAALPATAVAQSPAVTDPVTVTAKGFEALVADTPRSVNIITAEEIAFTEARTLGDLFIGQPGLSVATDGSVGLDPIIRGLKRDQVVVLIDGARVNLFQPGARGSMAAYVSVDLIERIEIIRGPSSVLYGSGASGGVINIITKSGRFTDEPTVSGWTRLGVNSADQGYRGALGTSFSDDRNVIDISASYMNTGDYRAGDGERLRDSGTAQNAFHLGYKRKLDERQQVEFRAQYDERRDVWFLASRTNTRNPENNVDLAAETTGIDSLKGFSRPDGITTHYGPYQTRTLYEGRYFRDLEHDWAPRLRLSGYFQQLKRGNYDFSDQFRRDYFTSDNVFDNYGASAHIEFAPTDNSYLVTGIDYQQLKTTPEACFWDSNYNPGSCNDIAGNATLESYGLFAQGELDFDSYVLDLGVRLDRVTGDADFASGIAPPLKRTDNVFSWSLGGLIRVANEFEPYANLSQGYRAAGLLERFLNFPGSDGLSWIGDPQLKPERNLTLEIGARGQVGSTAYSVAIYESQIRDYIGVERPTGDPPSRRNINLDKARIRGFEYTVNHSLDRDMSIYSTGTWLRGDNQDGRYNEPLTQMPPPEVSLGIAQQPSRGWNWRAQIRAVAKQDRVAPSFNPTERTTPGFATADAFVGYRFGPAMGFNSSELQFSLTNIFDKDYREHVNEMTEERLVGSNRVRGDGVQDLKRPGRSIGLAWYARF